MTAIDFYSPDTYVAGPPHDLFEQLRREQPVVWQDMPDGTGYWAVLRHADVVTVSREPVLFSAATGGVVLEDLSPENLAMMQDMLLAMDPPRHLGYRRSASPHFAPRVMAQLEGRIREICQTIMRDSGDRDLDFVHDVCARLPSQVVGELMGIPEADWPKIHHWSEMNSGSQDPDIMAADPEAAEAAMSATVEMAMYAIELAGRRRSEPADDLTTLMLAVEVDGAAMTDIQFGSFFVQLVTAGNDTTRTMLSSGLLALLDHPEQLAELRHDHSLIPTAVEEILRYANPLHYFRRTATADTTLGGVEIKTGDKVAMMYTSANRDAAVFVRPNEFDIHRDPNPHLSFGTGEHFCLGIHLARLEGRVFFEELFDHFPVITQTGPARRQRSNLNNALKELPVRLSTADV
ncbi:MAG: cytochrome P450 [Acidimicrobiia bacterium]|nr:cytochrome P450 [Acidimicrobiia bacterium]